MLGFCQLGDAETGRLCSEGGRARTCELRRTSWTSNAGRIGAALYLKGNASLFKSHFILSYFEKARERSVRQRS